MPFNIVFKYLALQIDFSLPLKLAKILDKVLFVLSLKDQWVSYEAVLCFKQNKRELLKKNKDMRRRETMEKQGRCETRCLMLQCGVLKCLSHFTFIFNKPPSVSTLHVEWTPQSYMYWSICVNVLGCIFERDCWNTSGWLFSSFPEVSLSDTLLKHILHPPIFWQNTVCFASSEVVTSRVVKHSYIQTDSLCKLCGTHAIGWGNVAVSAWSRPFDDFIPS